MLSDPQFTIKYTKYETADTASYSGPYTPSSEINL